MHVQYIYTVSYIYIIYEYIYIIYIYSLETVHIYIVNIRVCMHVQYIYAQSRDCIYIIYIYSLETVNIYIVHAYIHVYSCHHADK